MDMRIIYSKRVALALIRSGYDLVKIERNKITHKGNVFLFKTTPEILSDIENLTKSN